MNKHQRLKQMVTANRKWLLVRLGFAIPVGVLLFFFLQNTTNYIERRLQKLLGIAMCHPQ